MEEIQKLNFPYKKLGGRFFEHAQKTPEGIAEHCKDRNLCNLGIGGKWHFTRENYKN